jgi:hypothetical protein
MPREVENGYGTDVKKVTLMLGGEDFLFSGGIRISTISCD